VAGPPRIFSVNRTGSAWMATSTAFADAGERYFTRATSTAVTDLEVTADGVTATVYGGDAP
jgi:hypothetical protein